MMGVPAASSGRPKGFVQSVTGPIAVSKLGFTLTHEHVCVTSPALLEDRAGAVTRAVAELRAAKAAGIDTIVDATPFDARRDVRFGQEISRRSGMQIVACTGQHLFAPESFTARNVDEIAAFFIREIEHGIDDSDIKAGVIKVATRADALTSNEENSLRAAARASKATGVPVATHTHSRRRGGENQAAIFEAEGLSPARVSLGHSDDTDDMEYLLGLARRGYTLGMDHINRGAVEGAKVSWKRRVECIKALVDAGFAERIFLSNDWIFGDEERARTNPDGLLFNTRKTIPFMKEIGITGSQIRTMTSGNPRRFWAS